MGAVVGHGSTVGPGSVVAANAVLNARVELGEGVYIGSTATLIPELHVGDWATVGAGSLVLQDVPAGASVLGVPAEVVYCREDAAQGHGAPASLVIGEADTRPARSVAQLQTVIAEAWQSILGHASGMEQSFFDAGGTSLCAMRVRERLLEREQIRLATTDIYRFPTVRALAEHLARGEEGLALGAMGRAAARLAARRAR